jgi:LacI family transcriptional regulator
MRDIGDICGVNQSTVSRALRNDCRLGKETIDRVRAVAEQLGYDPMRNQVARRLAGIKWGKPILNNTIGYFFTHLGFTQSNYFTRVNQGVLHAINEVDFEIFTSDQYKAETRRELPGAYRRGDIDGTLAIIEDYAWQSTREMLRREPNFQNRPIVGLVEPLEGCSAVYPDNESAARQVMEHLLELGHRRIVHFHTPHSDDIFRSYAVHDTRLVTYIKVLREWGLDETTCLIKGAYSPGFEDNEEIALESILSSGLRPTAMIAHNDEHAVQLHKRLTARGLHVPDDMSLISYDDTEIILDDHSTNILTTVRMPLFEVGQRGTMLLINRILGREPEDRCIALETELIVRHSTGPALR